MQYVHTLIHRRIYKNISNLSAGYFLPRARLLPSRTHGSNEKGNAYPGNRASCIQTSSSVCWSAAMLQNINIYSCVYIHVCIYIFNRHIRYQYNHKFENTPVKGRRPFNLTFIRGFECLRNSPDSIFTPRWNSLGTDRRGGSHRLKNTFYFFAIPWGGFLRIKSFVLFEGPESMNP